MTAGVGLAQEEGGQGPEGRGEKGRMRPGKFDHGVGAVKLLTRKLNLDETQQAEFERLFKEHAESEAELRSAYMPSDEMREKMQQIREEIMAAREAGDTEKLEELKTVMREMLEEQKAGREPLRQKMSESMVQLHDKLLVLLNDDQKGDFEEVWETKIARRLGPAEPSPRRPQALKAAIGKLKDITPEQKEQIQILFEEFRKSEREAGTDEEKPKQGKKLEKKRIKQLYKDVLAVLTPEQRSEVEKKLTHWGGPKGEKQRRGPQGGHPQHGHDHGQGHGRSHGHDQGQGDGESH